MQQKGLEPSVITYTAAISACENGKHPEKALELLGEMQQKADVITHSAAIIACKDGKHVLGVRGMVQFGKSAIVLWWAEFQSTSISPLDGLLYTSLADTLDVS